VVKAKSKQFNARLRLPARFALEDLAAQWSCSETAACERAILEAHGRISKIPTEIRDLATPNQVRDSYEVITPIKGEVAIFCRHCGSQFGGQKFQPPICEPCKSGGHVGEPRNCSLCTEKGTGAI
jgi:hypothetical protein